ncbi:hypothetical protein MKX03_016582 [Papaver bracteatum]|nr:hypothetical protein MKX03_016582 [Papaver bracteatum]
MDAKPSIRIVAKRLWSIVRVAFFMIRKGMSKNNKSFMLHLYNIMYKRGKISSKLISNLMLFHHPNHSSQVSSSKIPRHYEFSCSDSPAAAHMSNTSSSKHEIQHRGNFSFSDEDMTSVNAMQKIFEMLHNQVMTENGSSTVPSPYLPGLGFGHSPMNLAQSLVDLRFYPLFNHQIIHSDCWLLLHYNTFPLRDDVFGKINCHLDEYAEEFIEFFYAQLRLQKSNTALQELYAYNMYVSCN